MMPRMIVLTALDNDGPPLFVNPNHIVWFYENDDRTLIQLNGSSRVYKVKETPEEIIELMEENE